MSSQPRLGVSAALAYFFLTGPWGADKHYVGSFGKSYSNAKTAAWVQTAIAITFIGLYITIPWSWMSTLALVISILFGSVPFLYPQVKWAPIDNVDKTIALVIVGLAIFYTGGYLFIFSKFYFNKEKYKNPETKKTNKNMKLSDNSM